MGDIPLRITYRDDPRASFYIRNPDIRKTHAIPEKILEMLREKYAPHFSFEEFIVPAVAQPLTVTRLVIKAPPYRVSITVENSRQWLFQVTKSQKVLFKQSLHSTHLGRVSSWLQDKTTTFLQGHHELIAADRAIEEFWASVSDAGISL